MQTLKNIHKEYLNKLAEGIVIKCCISECKCESDNSTEKKKCLLRKNLNGSDKDLVDLWFDLIDGISEVIYKKTVDDMAYPELIRDHLSQTKAKNFYKVLSDEFESIVLDIYKKVCMRIPDACRENPGFEELVDYAKKELLEYFTFEKAFSYSRYMIENHSYIEDWFPIADMDTIGLLLTAKEEPTTLYENISEKNCEFTESIEDLLEFTYKEMYKKSEKELLLVFFDDTYEEAYDAGQYEYYINDCEDDDDCYPIVKNLIDDYLHRPLPIDMFYEYAWERIALITSKGKDNKKKQKSVSKKMGCEGEIPALEKQKEYYKGNPKLEHSRLQIYLSQMKTTNDDIYVKELNRSESSSSKGDVKKKILRFYDALLGINLLKIYKKDPYNNKNVKFLLIPKHAYIPDYMKFCLGCSKTCFTCGPEKAQQLMQIITTALFIMTPDRQIIKEATKKNNKKSRNNYLEDMFYTFDEYYSDEYYYDEDEIYDSYLK